MPGTGPGKDQAISKFRITIFIVLPALVLVAAGLAWFFYNDQSAQTADTGESLHNYPSTARFELVDHNGKLVSDQDYRGRFMLVSFGYTWCPDVCPIGLQAISDILDLLAGQAKWVQPLFITIDPERDTPEVMKDYVSNFHPRLIGLTGTSEQIRQVAAEFGFKFIKSMPDGGPGVDKEDEDYLMSHAASIYLVGIDGRMLEDFNYGMAGTAIEAIAERIRHFVNIQEALARAR